MILLLGQNGTGPEVTMESTDQGFATAVGFLNNYSVIFVIAFLVTLLITPVVRQAAMANDIVDHPDNGRKRHREPVAYLGGIAVFLGLIVAICFSYFPFGGATPGYAPVPWSIVAGLTAITLAGLADDMWGWDPRLKIAGQLVAAACLAIEDVGVRVAEGLLRPMFAQADTVLLDFVGLAVTSGDIYYWAGTAIIAIFVLGGCNSANLVDGLDGLLSGVMAIVAIGLLIISLLMAMNLGPDEAAGLAGARIVLCLALLGTVLGFLPHNFSPASVFLGDSGSLLLGFMAASTILMLGEQGQTHLVFAGLIVFSVPVMDTVLAIVRRKVSGLPMSSADDQHIHHQLLRTLGGVKKAVIALYGISAAFAAIGVTLAGLVLQTELRVRVLYAAAIVLFGFVGVIAFKAARSREYRRQAAMLAERQTTRGGSGNASLAASSTPPSGIRDKATAESS